MKNWHFPPSHARAFMLVELFVIIGVLALLAATYGRSLSKKREEIHITVDLANVRQILRASALYSTENDDRLAHPTWGSDLTGPDGWAYLTSNKARQVPGALGSTPGSCAGYDINSRQFTNQLAYFKAGQVTQYLPDVQTAWCPKDVATRRSGRLRQLWLGRPVKVTSYAWNGTIGGYVGPKAQALNGKTHKTSQFLPTDFQMWEDTENDPFHFNDAATNPQNPGETFSLRHSGVADWFTVAIPKRDLPGGAIVGRFDGSAQFIEWSTAYDLAYGKRLYPNELLNGPGYR